MILIRLLCTALFTSSLAACVALPSQSCGADETRALQDTLYFGTGKPQGGVVTAQEWATFLATAVTPRFPAGLSVIDAGGQWLGANGQIVQEQTYVLQLVHSADAASDAAVNDITAAYKQQFQQEAVLRVRTGVCMAL
jgi:hypothetical protein